MLLDGPVPLPEERVLTVPEIPHPIDSPAVPSVVVGGEWISALSVEEGGHVLEELRGPVQNG